MGRSDGANAETDGDRHREAKRQRTPDHDGEHGVLTDPIEHGRQHRARDGEANAAASMDTFDHAANVGRERGKESPIPVSPAMATLAGRSAASTKLCTAISWAAAPATGAQNPVLDQPRPGRPGDRTDNDKQQGSPNSVAPQPSGNRAPSPGVGGVQCPRPIDLVAGCPLLHKADPAQAGKNVHVHQHRHGDDGDGGRLDVAIGLLEGDNDKRQHEVDRQQQRRT